MAAEDTAPAWGRADDLRGLRLGSASRLSELVPWLRYGPEGEMTIVDGPPLEGLRPSGGASIVYSIPAVLHRYRELRRAFAARFDRVRVAYAVKACYVPQVLRALVAEGAGLEVMSGVELDLAVGAGCPGASLVSNGVGLRRDHAAAAISQGGLVIVDNIRDLHLVNDIAAAAGARVRLGLRVTPEVPGERFIGAGAKLGCDWAGGHFLALVDEALRMGHCDVVALHAHQLTHGNDPVRYGVLVSGVAEVARQVERLRSLRFKTIDIGGGFDTGYLLTARGLSVADFAVAAHEALDIGYPFELVLEPGRHLVADAAVGLTAVTGEKVNGDRRWLITELGSNILIPLPDLAYHPLPLRYPADGGWSRYDVGDGTCAPTSLCRDALLPHGPERLDLAVLNVGAYTSVFAESWAFPLPDILAWDGSAIHSVLDGDGRTAMFAALHGTPPRTPAPC